MGAPTDTFVDPDATATGGNDFGGTSFTDGVSSSSGTVVTKTGAFTATHVNDKVYLEDNGSGDVTAGLYKLSARTNDTITVPDIRSGAGEATDVKCTQHTGTSSLPWNTAQHALDVTTRDSTNGDQFNVKNGTDDTLSAALSLATYGTPTRTAPLLFRGYTSAADDGGIGAINGDGSVGVLGGKTDNAVFFIDMHLHNCGSVAILALNNDIVLDNCELNNTSDHGADLDANPSVNNCHFHDLGGTGLLVTIDGMVANNYFANGTKTFTTAADISGMFVNNIINLSTSGNASNGIKFRDRAFVHNNSVWSDAGTGKGIVESGTSKEGVSVRNNIVEGFSGTGGFGYRSSPDDSWIMYGGNASYQNTTHYAVLGEVLNDQGDNEVLDASPFADPSSDDFTVDTSVRATALPLTFKGASTDQAMDKGAAQRVEPAAGGLSAKAVIIQNIGTY